MIQYTDAELTVTVEGTNLLDADEVHLTFRQGNRVVDVIPQIISETSMTVVLSQQKTAIFRHSSPVHVQLNFILNGIRKASEIAEIPVKSNLLQRILPNE